MEGVITPKEFTVRTSSYEGPFELVLELIEKRKLLVNELSLSQVTDDYIQHVRSQAAFPMEAAANFIGVAATLLLIKSRSLIPDLDLSTEEEGDVEELKDRLRLYEKTRDAAQQLGHLFGSHVLVSAGDRESEPVFAPSRDLSLDSLEKALREALLSHEKEEKLPEARVRPMVTIEEMMDRLSSRVQSALTLSFREFSGTNAEKIEVIVSFLALLELVKQGIVEAAQPGVFSDIKITNASAGVPHYG
ncbi:segregation/condensation protein A [Patescibacteria group bacterium]|nr:segregation/condensation protein A [Patescibacteria group bacterium]